ncbi:MAG TPA: aminopeptidase P family protein [Pyrinomonadaceae bacterium]|nr:aminopeptidase P family protein [Pyrinomonadaceae bacterium]
MRVFKASRVIVALCLVVSLAAVVTSSVRSKVAIAAQTSASTSAQKVIRITPPAPVFNAEERRAELAERRARVASQVGAKGVMILFGAEPRLYTNDVDYEYRQENNLFYLTHLNQAGATLVLLPGSTTTREILFLPRRDPARETWNGYMYSPEDAQRISGLNEIWDAREFEPFTRALMEGRAYYPRPENVLLSALKPQATVETASQLFAAAAKSEAMLYLLVPRRDAESGEFGDSREWRREQRFAEGWRKTVKGYTIRSAFPIFSEMRLRKSPSEIRLLQHAVDITTEGFGRAMAVAGRAQWEYEVEAEIEYTFKRRNADQWGYPSIVGCGPNATTLHYVESQGRVAPGDLLLMDVGAEYQHYTADVTRTFPISGKFTPEQADIYNIVLAAQEAAFNVSRPGSTKDDVHKAATEAIKDGLLRLGLITSREGTVTVNNRQVPQYRLWFMHGTSHWLGMAVHDIGEGNPKLEPGMVYTNEPGIYIRADALQYLPKTPENDKFTAAVRAAFEKYKNIGVRIEDDVLITPDGYRNLSAALPRTIPDIEAFMARAARELGER